MAHISRRQFIGGAAATAATVTLNAPSVHARKDTRRRARRAPRREWTPWRRRSGRLGRRWIPHRRSDNVPSLGVAAWSNSGPARRAPRRSLKTIPSFSCEIVLPTSIVHNRRFLVLKSVSCSSSTAGNTQSPSAGRVRENTVNPNWPQTSSVVESTYVRSVVRNCSTTYVCTCTPARCFQQKYGTGLRLQGRRLEPW